MNFYNSDDYDEEYDYYDDYDDETLNSCACTGPKMIGRPQKENFVSSGTMGAHYNEDMDTITGPALYTNHMLQNGTTWKKLKNDVKKKGIASDGSLQLGAGTGNGYDRSMGAHIKNMEIMQSANNEYNNPEILRQITKNINEDLSSNPENSMYNRGNQTCGKMIELNGRAIGVLPEEFYPEREKNRNIYKAQEIIPIPGFNVNIERLGENLSESHSCLYVKRSHRKNPVALGGVGNLEDHIGKIAPPDFQPKGKPERFTGPMAMNKEAFTTTQYAKTGEDNLHGYMKGIDGANYWIPKRF